MLNESAPDAALAYARRGGPSQLDANGVQLAYTALERYYMGSMLGDVPGPLPSLGSQPLPSGDIKESLESALEEAADHASTPAAFSVMRLPASRKRRADGSAVLAGLTIGHVDIPVPVCPSKIAQLANLTEPGLTGVMCGTHPGSEHRIDGTLARLSPELQAAVDSHATRLAIEELGVPGPVVAYLHQVVLTCGAQRYTDPWEGDDKDGLVARMSVELPQSGGLGAREVEVFDGPMEARCSSRSLAGRTDVALTCAMLPGTQHTVSTTSPIAVTLMFNVFYVDNGNRTPAAVRPLRTVFDKHKAHLDRCITEWTEELAKVDEKRCRWPGRFVVPLRDPEEECDMSAQEVPQLGEADQRMVRVLLAFEELDVSIGWIDTTLQGRPHRELPEHHPHDSSEDEDEDEELMGCRPYFMTAGYMRAREYFSKRNGYRAPCQPCGCEDPITGEDVDELEMREARVVGREETWYDARSGGLAAEKQYTSELPKAEVLGRCADDGAPHGDLTQAKYFYCTNSERPHLKHELRLPALQVQLRRLPVRMALRLSREEGLERVLALLEEAKGNLGAAEHADLRAVAGELLDREIAETKALHVMPLLRALRTPEAATKVLNASALLRSPDYTLRATPGSRWMRMTSSDLREIVDMCGWDSVASAVRSLVKDCAKKTQFHRDVFRAICGAGDRQSVLEVIKQGWDLQLEDMTLAVETFGWGLMAEPLRGGLEKSRRVFPAALLELVLPVENAALTSAAVGRLRLGNSAGDMSLDSLKAVIERHGWTQVWRGVRELVSSCRISTSGEGCDRSDVLRLFCEMRIAQGAAYVIETSSPCEQDCKLALADVQRGIELFGWPAMRESVRQFFQRGSRGEPDRRWSPQGWRSWAERQWCRISALQWAVEAGLEHAAAMILTHCSAQDKGTRVSASPQALASLIDKFGRAPFEPQITRLLAPPATGGAAARPTAPAAQKREPPKAQASVVQRMLSGTVDGEKVESVRRLFLNKGLPCGTVEAERRQAARIVKTVVQKARWTLDGDADSADARLLRALVNLALVVGALPALRDAATSGAMNVAALCTLVSAAPALTKAGAASVDALRAIGDRLEKLWVEGLKRRDGAMMTEESVDETMDVVGALLRHDPQGGVRRVLRALPGRRGKIPRERAPLLRRLASRDEADELQRGAAELLLRLLQDAPAPGAVPPEQDMEGWGVSGIKIEDPVLDAFLQGPEQSFRTPEGMFKTDAQARVWAGKLSARVRQLRVKPLEGEAAVVVTKTLPWLCKVGGQCRAEEVGRLEKMLAGATRATIKN